MVDIIEHDSYITNHELHGRVRETNLNGRCRGITFVRGKKLFFGWGNLQSLPFANQNELQIGFANHRPRFEQLIICLIYIYLVQKGSVVLEVGFESTPVFLTLIIQTR